jgi:ankyrin repeat protein
MKFNSFTILMGLLLSHSLSLIPSVCHGSSLLELVEVGNTKDALQLLATDRGTLNVNVSASDGSTILHWAVYHGDLVLVAALLEAGADPNTVNDYGSSPMQEAASVGSLPLIETLLNAGADVESPNFEGQTALMAVARTGNLQAATILLQNGAKVDAVENWGGQTALMWAAARKQPEMIELLAKWGADLDKRAIDRNWQRRVTAEPRVKEMFSGGFTALLYAAREGCLECAQALIEAGADINLPDPDNISPLVLALINMKFDVAKYLIQQGADVDAWDYWGRTPLYAATDLNILPNSQRGDLPPLQSSTGIEIANLLLDRGAHINYALKLAPPPREIAYDRAGDNPVMTTGSTPLQRAAYGADVGMMSLLLSHGADPYLANINGVTPLIALTSNGGSRNRNKNEVTVIEGMELLIEAGLDLNQPGGVNGEAPIHTSVRQGWGKVVRFLAEHGANLYQADSNGLLPMDYANGKADSQSFGNFNVVGELPEMIALLQTLMDENPR